MVCFETNGKAKLLESKAMTVNCVNIIKKGMGAEVMLI